MLLYLCSCFLLSSVAENAPATELKVPGEVVIAQSPPERLPSANILDDLRDQDRCIKTPEEYVAAFEAREARCVDPDLVGRTSSGVDVAGATLNTSFKLAYFWVGSDALAKYLRIGFPETIGGTREFTRNSCFHAF